MIQSKYRVIFNNRLDKSGKMIQKHACRRAEILRSGVIIQDVDKRTTGLFLFHLASILDRVYQGNVILVGGGADAADGFSCFDKYAIYSIKKRISYSGISRAINFTHLQAMISYRVLNLINKVDLWVFLGGPLLMPMLATKLLRKKSIVLLLSYMEIESKIRNEIFYKPMVFHKKINLLLASHIVVYSPILIKEWNLEKYRNKISIAHEHFLNFDKFKMGSHVHERNDIIGYIGRLSEEKGAQNFAEAISKIHNEKDKLNFMIGGDGEQCDKIKRYIEKNSLCNNVSLHGWIPHDELPGHLNQLKLLVMPSYTEGLPNIMLEAMACGTPVLATPVGAIPDIIKDNQTGFLMENNSPECIAANVVRALEHPDLDGIAKRARALVEREFTLEKAVEKWSKLLEEISDYGKHNGR